MIRLNPIKVVTKVTYFNSFATFKLHILVFKVNAMKLNVMLDQTSKTGLK